jgi:hypothetical protein
LPGSAPEPRIENKPIGRKPKREPSNATEFDPVRRLCEFKERTVLDSQGPAFKVAQHRERLRRGLMKNLIWSISLLALTMLSSAPSVYPKGSPKKIVVTGGGLACPIEVKDREALKGFDPWRGQFIDWAKQMIVEPTNRDRYYEGLSPSTGRQGFWKFVEPPDQDQSYQVLFYMKWKGRHSTYDQGNLKMIYSLLYCPGRNGGPGYVYLPGENDSWNRVNMGTICREDHDGKWHYASVAWDLLMNRVLRLEGSVLLIGHHRLESKIGVKA